MTEATGPLLSVRSLRLSFSGLRALSGVSFDVPDRTIFGLIGPNGAGKSTLLNCLSRIYTPDAGEVCFGTRDLTQVPVHRLVDLGIARTFQNLELFSAETALENVMVGALGRLRSGFVGDLLGLPPARRVLDQARDVARAALLRLGLQETEGRVVATLPYGVQKRIELARALVTEPKLLLLDEPAAGLNRDETEAMGRVIRELRDGMGITTILVEHDMQLVMGICDEVAVLDHGELIASGPPSVMRRNARVIQAYLGDDAAHAA